MTVALVTHYVAAVMKEGAQTSLRRLTARIPSRAQGALCAEEHASSFFGSPTVNGFGAEQRVPHRSLQLVHVCG